MDQNLIDELQNAVQVRRKRIISIIAIGLFVLVLGIAPLFIKFIVVVDASSPYELKSLEINFEKGMGISLGHRLLVFSDSATVEVKYAGHFPVDAQITATTGTLNIEPKPLPGYLSLKEPSQFSEILVDGFDVLKIIAAGDLTLSAGSHYLQVSNRECGQFATRFTVRPEETLLLEPVFLKKPVNLEITSDPTGADIVSCGRVIGRTPLTGRYELANNRVLVRKDGFRSTEITAGVAAVSLEPLISVPIELTPKGGLLSGALHSLSKDTLYLKERLPVTLKYEAVGHFSQQFEITSAKQKIRVDLKKITAPVRVSSNVPAEVFLDGNYVGKTPVSLVADFGDRVVVLRASGYKSEERLIPVRSNEAIDAEIRLETLSNYRLRSSPGQYVPSGMTSALVRIAAKELTMGSTLGERGAAANEVRKSVVFAREFYMGVAEVSEAEFSAFTPSVKPSEMPIAGISWFDAARFCNWLSEKNKLDPFYIFDEEGAYVGINKASVGFRLPTEAEWEYVAGKYRRSEKSVFVWGNKYRLDKSAGNIADVSAKNIAKAHVSDYDDGYPELAPVSYGEKRHGFLNFSGNVAEWVTDTYVLEFPSRQPIIDPIETLNTGAHTVKGSSFLSSDWLELRVAFRNSSPNAREDIGFRVARYVD